MEGRECKEGMRLLNFGVKGKCTEKNHAFQILQDGTPDLTRTTRREGGSWASCHLPSSVGALMLLVFESSESHSVVSDSLRPQWTIYSSRNSPGQNTGVGSRSLLQGIFPTQRLNPGLPHCRQILYQLSHQGSPRILE